MGMITLRRYTNLAAALHLLRNRCLTLLSPSTWDDRNDAFFMSEYKRQTEAKTVLALCFAEDKESYHHWRVFSHGTDGVCIEFDKAAIQNAIEGEPHLTARSVEYLLIDEATRTGIKCDDLPFRKRVPYADEREFRLVYVDLDDEIAVRHLPINLACIDRITLSPWMHKSLSDAVRDTIKGLPDCANLNVYRSSLIENERWKKIANPDLIGVEG